MWRRPRALLLAVAVITTLAVPFTTSSASAAAPVTRTWTLSNVTFTDGGTASGTFDFSSDGVMSNVDISTAGGTVLTPFRYGPGFSGILSNQGDGYLIFARTAEGRVFRQLFLSNQGLAAASTGDMIPLNSSSYECNNCVPFRRVASGALVAGDVVSPTPADTTAPVVTPAVDPPAPDGTQGWYTGSPSVGFAVNDPDSAITATDGCDPTTIDSDTTGITLTCSATSAGGTGSGSVTIKRDATVPTAALSAGPAEGQTYWTTTVPAAPTCDASDATSGVATCIVSGYSAAAGQHTVTATATDNAGNTSSAGRSYTVRDMTSTGFYAPVDGGGVYNTIKGGSSVPLKFNVLIDGVQQTSTAVVTGFTATRISCDPSAGTDEVELATTGASALRYDSTAGQYIQIWKTPTGAGTCYRATITLSDGDTIEALFKLR